MPRLRLPPWGAADTGRSVLLAAAAIASAAALVAVLRATLWSDGVPSVAAPPVDAFFDAEVLDPGRRYREGLWAFAVALAPLPAAVAIVVALAGERWRRRLLRSSGGRLWLAGAIFGVGLALLTALVTLPLRAGRFAWARSEGPVVQPIGDWLWDVGKWTAIQMLIMGLLGSLVVVVLARLPRVWPAVLAAVAAAVIVASSVLAPSVSDLFMRTEPLRDPVLRAQVLDLAERAGVPADDVRVNDASARTNAPNAFVAGLGRGRRIVLFDTLVRDFPPEEVRAVTAHELAHVARRHVLKGTVWGVLLMVPAALMIAAVVGWRTGFGPPLRNPQGRELVLRRMAVVAATAAVLGVLATPLLSAVSRAYEAEADWVMLRLTEDSDAAVRLRQRSVARSVGVPDPPRAIQLWFGTHPTAMERIALALAASRTESPS